MLIIYIILRNFGQRYLVHICRAKVVDFVIKIIIFKVEDNVFVACYYSNSVFSKKIYLLCSEHT